MVANLDKTRANAVSRPSDFDDDFPEVEETPLILPGPVLISDSAVEPGSRDVVQKEFPVGPLLERRLREYVGAAGNEGIVPSTDPSYESLAVRIAKLVQIHFADELKQRNRGFLIASRLEEREEDGKVQLKYACSADIEPPKSDMDDGIKRTIDRLVRDERGMLGVLRITHPVFEVEPNADNSGKKELPYFCFSVELSELPSAAGFRARIECSSAYSDADDPGLKGAFKYTRHFFALRKVVREVFEAFGMPLAKDSVLEQMITYLRLQNLSNEGNHKAPPKGSYGETAYNLTVEMSVRPSEVDVLFHDQSGFAQKAVDVATREAAFLKFASVDEGAAQAKYTLGRMGKLHPETVDMTDDDGDGFGITRYEEQTFEIVGKDRRKVQTTHFYVNFSRKR
jgi:hypothetical protein